MIRELDVTRSNLSVDSLSHKFANAIVGQPEATEALVYLLEKYQAGFYDRSKPLASLLFLGPTGTGKTAVAEEFVNGVFNHPEFLVKIDCAEFQHSQEIARLIGSPPGYIGHKETHPFFTKQRLAENRNSTFPFTVILWDEVEKANDALWSLMLGILDKGKLTVGTSEVVDFQSTVHILTSNVGARELSDDSLIGFTRDGQTAMSNAMTKEIALNAARRKFMPEFMGRLDKVVVFNAPTPDEVSQILGIQIDRLKDRISERSRIPFFLRVSPSAFKQLVEEGFSRKENARFLKKTLEKRVESPLAKFVSTGQVFKDDAVVVNYVNGEWRYLASTNPVSGGVSSGQLEMPESAVLQ